MNFEQLEKGLAALDAVANQSKRNPTSRTALLAKAEAGTLTAGERDLLIKSLNGGGGALASEVTAGLNADEIAKSSTVDVSGFLLEQHEGIVKGFTTLADRLEKSEADESQWRQALAASFHAQAQLVKSLIAKVDELSGQPARMPRTVGAGTPAERVAMEKSMNGQSQRPVLSKSVVLDVMEELAEKNNGRSASGEDLTLAIARYEGSTEISKSLSQEVTAHYRATRAA